MTPADRHETPRDPRLAGVADLLRAGSAEPASGARVAASLEGRRRLVSAVEAMGAPSQGRARRWAPALAAAAAIALVIGFALVRLGEPAALTYAVEGGGAGARGYVSIAPGASTATVRFSDGSEVALANGTRSRVASTSPDGAEVVLEAGSAAVHVVHRGATRWTFDAGPYAVRVTGTAFTVAWSADRGALDVWMREGRVVVAGPAAAQGVPLVGGQHLHADATVGSLVIDGAAAPLFGGAAPAPSGSDDAPAPPIELGPDESPATSLDPAHDAPRARRAPGDGSASWSKLVEIGDYDAVLSAAHQQGEGRALAARPIADVRALGDAARYRGDAALASRAYAAIRARFAKSGEARTAAFLLGRVAEEQQHAPAAALAWYDTYLKEAPSGPLVGDALGRKMLLTAGSQGAPAARDLARDYLRRFPRGAYASAARDLAP